MPAHDRTRPAAERLRPVIRPRPARGAEALIWVKAATRKTGQATSHLTALWTAPMPSPTWIDQLFASIDARDAERFGSFLAPDACFRFGNAPAVHGQAAIQEYVAGFFAALAGLRHEIQDVWTPPDATICHGQVTYTRLDASTLTVPFADVLKGDAGVVHEYLIFADTSTLFAV